MKKQIFSVILLTLLLILIGIIIGNFFRWVDPQSFGDGAKLFSTFALIFILFQGALSIEFKSLIKSLSNTLNLTVISFFLTLIVVFSISFLLGYPISISLLLGTILAGTSSAVVIPLVQNIDIRNKYGLVLTLESAISDVLCIIGTITILKVLKTGEIIPSLIFQNILSSFVLAIIVGAGVGFIWVLLLSKFEIFNDSYMLTIALVLGLYALIESSLVGASGAIGALAFGLIIGNSRSILTFNNKDKNKPKNNLEENSKPQVKNILPNSAKNFYNEISFFVKTFFFVYLGILIDFSNMSIFFYGAILTLAIFLIRPFAVKFVFRNQKIEKQEKVILEILIPKGLAAAVLAGIVVQSGFITGFEKEFVSLILSVVFLSIVFTSILVFLSEKNWFRGFIPFLHKKN